MSVQLFVPKFRVEECLENIRECLEKGWTGLGFKTLEFEDAWKKYTQLPHAHFLSSNTVGLHLALEVFKKKYAWQENDEVISTPLTFVSTNHAIRYANLKPIFADVDDYLCLDPIDVERKITDKTKAIIFVGIGGNTGQFNKIVEICKQKKITLILDAAHMAGTKLNGEHVGQDADCTVYSFQAVKNLPTADSGMICFKDSEDDAVARKLSWLGINKDTYERTSNSKGTYKWYYDVEDVGFKYHGNSIMASIGLVSLKYLDEDNAYRRKMAEWYRQNLKNNPKIKFIETAPNCETSQHLFQVRVSRRDLVLQGLNECEIYPGVHYRDNTEYQMYNYAKGTCSKSNQLSEEILSLPLHLNLKEEDINYVSNILNHIVV